MSSTFVVVPEDAEDVVLITARQMKFLTTLRLLPDDVVLEVAGQELNLYSAEACLCAWALRATMAKLWQQPVETWDENRIFTYVARYHEDNTPKALAAKWGGTEGEWSNIFTGVVQSNVGDIEFAWTVRVSEAVERTAYALA